MSNIVDDDGCVWIRVGTDKYVTLADIRSSCEIKTGAEIRDASGPTCQVRLPWEKS